MASSDSTPDFSWLNKKDSENEESQKDQPQSDQQDSVHDDDDEEVAENVGEPKPDINPTAETWIQESPELPKPFIAKPIITPETSLPKSDEPEVEEPAATESDSVLDDDSEEEVSSDDEKNAATLIMPGRQLSEEENDKLNTSNRPEDLTVVLPTEIPGQEGSPLQNETFAEPESPKQEAPEEEVIGLNVDQLEESGAAPLDTSENTAESEDLHTDVASEAEAVADESTSAQPEATEPEPIAAPTASKSSPVQQDEEKKSNTSFILLASYASAITLIALFLLMKGGSKPVNEHLESLPDVAPEPAGELSYIPVHAPLPAGHVLKIGEKQRYGNIEVEPLRVVKEPLEFSHYSSNPKLKRPATEPVVKIWLKFTNVSKDQQIAPLDGDLLLRWVTNSEQQREYSNQYLFAEGATEPEQEISTYRHSKTSDWDLSDQKLGKVLEPGESYETYIASSEAIPSVLPEKLNWRIQFRKGYSANGGGVTTVIDVAFQKNEVKSAAQAEKAS